MGVINVNTIKYFVIKTGYSLAIFTLSLKKFRKNYKNCRVAMTTFT